VIVGESAVEFEGLVDGECVGGVAVVVEEYGGLEDYGVVGGVGGFV